MIMINQEKCIGCGACAKDCPGGHIYISDGKAYMDAPFCIRCGHCFALCPADAIRLQGYTEEEHQACEMVVDENPVDPHDLLHAMKSRRSMRQFTDREVEPEKLQMLLEAIRFAPTGSNRQEVWVRLIREDLAEFTALVTRTLAEFAEELPENASERLKTVLPYYQNRWKNMEKQYFEDGLDGVFRGAKTVLVLTGTDDVDAAIAASYAELLAYTLGLGCVYVGFARLAAEDEKVRKYLKLRKRERVVCTLALGYPAVQYRRTVPRKKRTRS